ncbi:GDP-mannose 4,6-dehydratase [Planctopirus limnophila DSM 3776]|uniref:GDP-mannose 4,6-dehydratase n=1 Tax=Planctopirus limnophila (strain ATCC 43296 / DSM 3776 / IFAM 1008 / Mu 290) TaxID=521674 RepID=D5SUH1_PLAL2|nr:GDP-mannose 4,6-dehydratase [Planctopirus limnophila]ADG69224.1 GDP-mannose 4,6-dehydratase [Planctopirus limnophila DSM 3776]
MTSAKRALITGITGQDGSYLADLLLEKGYEVHGLMRRTSSISTQRIEHLLCGNQPRVVLHTGDLGDTTSIQRVLKEAQPHEIYHLGAQSHVHHSFTQPLYTADVVALGTLRLLESAIQLAKTQEVRFYNAASSEMFGHATIVPQNEETPFHPRSPYACSKVFGYHQTINHREAYGLYAANGILFNHESPRRGEQFVTRKITLGAARIKVGLQKKLALGNLDAQRDWGFAKDYVEAMWLMLQQPVPGDYVVATNETHTVREFLEETFRLLDLDPAEYVEIDPAFFRPSEVPVLKGDYSKAEKELGWKPATNFKELVRLMVEADLALAQKEAAQSAI